MAWDNSTHASRRPGNWSSIRRRILDRDGHRCMIGLPGCTAQATDVDHVIPGDDHSDGNLRAACSWCNQRRNIAMRPRAASIYRKPEKHPGMVD